MRVDEPVLVLGGPPPATNASKAAAAAAADADANATNAAAANGSNANANASPASTSVWRAATVSAGAGAGAGALAAAAGRVGGAAMLTAPLDVGFSHYEAGDIHDGMLVPPPPPSHHHTFVESHPGTTLALLIVLTVPFLICTGCYAYRHFEKRRREHSKQHAAAEGSSKQDAESKATIAVSIGADEAPSVPPSPPLAAAEPPSAGLPPSEPPPLLPPAAAGAALGAETATSVHARLGASRTLGAITSAGAANSPLWAVNAAHATARPSGKGQAAWGGDAPAGALGSSSSSSAHDLSTSAVCEM